MDGGAISVSTLGTVQINAENNTFTDNFAENQGGGLNVTATSIGDITVADNRFIGNTCGDRGGVRLFIAIKVI